MISVISQTRSRTVEPGITIFTISGRLSLGYSLQSIETAIEKLINGGVRKLVIDLAELAYIDSAGIGMLVGCNGLMEQAGGTLRVSGAQGLVAKSFAVVHVDRILTVDPDLDSSTRSLAAGA
jgi:anti-anti-sigma factor